MDKTKKYYDQHYKNFPIFEIGDIVYFKKRVSSWLPASVVQVGPLAWSFIVKTPECVEYRRNRQHALKPNMINKPNEVEIKPQSNQTDNPNLTNTS